MRTIAPAAVQAAAPLTLDEKLALTGLAMDERLGDAGLRFDVDTAAIDSPEPPEILAAPMPATVPQPTTAVAVLQEAARMIATHGWIRRYVGNAETGFCAIGAIRKAAGGNSRLEDEAEGVMLDRILAQCPNALSIGQWNDSQSGPAPVIRILGG